MNIASDTSPTHRRQFILGRHEIRAKPEWVSVRLAKDLVLSRCPRLRVVTVADRDGRQWTVLGIAVQTDESRLSPQAAIAECATGAVLEETDSWAGRWVLIGEDEINLDACGLLGCYYRFVAGERAPWVSSSLSLLADLPGIAKPSVEQRKMIPEIGLDFDPPPLTVYAGVRKLLPSQILSLATGEVRGRSLVAGLAQARSYEDVLDALANYLTTVLKNLWAVSSPKGQLWIALTSGYDSRLLLAAAHRAGVPVKTFTQLFKGMSQGDRTFPPLLSRLVGVDHVAIWPKTQRPKLLEIYDEHTSLNVFMDRQFYASDQWSWTMPTDIILRGLGFEIGKRNYAHKFAPEWDPADPRTCKLILRAAGERGSSFLEESVGECLKWIASHPQDNMDWRDHFYIYCRISGWASATEQALDLVDGISIIPANSRTLYGLVRSVPEAKRLATQHHVDLIRRLSPGLLTYPINPADNFVVRNVKRLKKLSKRIRERGMVTTFYHLRAILMRRLVR